MAPAQHLTSQQLYQACDPAQFEFETTADLDDLGEIIGQERAIGAVHFGVGMRRPGYNLFALGPSGTGKRTTIRRYLDERAASEPTPSDWCYVNNFDQPHKPRALSMPPGRGAALRDDIAQLLDELRTAIPTAFESEDYRTRFQEAEEEFKDLQEQAFNELRERARERNIGLIRTPAGLAFVPLQEEEGKAEKEIIGQEEFQKLPEEKRDEIERDIAELQDQLQATVRQVREWERAGREKVKELNAQVALAAVGDRIEELVSRYADLPEVVEYLNAVKQDVIDNVEEFRKPAEEAPAQSVPVPLPRSFAESPVFRRYQVNLLVDHSKSTGAPVVYENHPTYINLIGRIEHIAQMGALLTDFSLIKPGALHQANGGYLIIDAREVLTQPYAWEGLKLALRSGELRIESLGQALSLVSTVSLEPEPIPLNIKIVLIGERLLYYLLYQYDPDFPELFKVEADFNEEIERTPENNLAYARLLALMTRQENVRPLTREAVARLIEHSARLSEDSERLSIHLASIADVLQEADFWAAENGHEFSTREDIQQAIDAQTKRADRVRERMYEQIARGTVLIDTTGQRVGQINGLSVIDMGKFAFGSPTRITARVRMGKGEVVDIEREVEMGGPIHSKGVLILSSFLGARYSTDRPLSLWASLVFEQTYAGVEGDSASLAELCVLLSALANVPINQSWAVTGSVSQHGQVQPIGGVNEKIEGFFDICQRRGLTGEHGVIIPTSNVAHLMLRGDVVAAVAAGSFHIAAVASVDEAITLLTGAPAGERDEAGQFPEGTVNRLVEQRLVDLAERQRAFESADKDDCEGEDEESDDQPQEKEAGPA
ncbi:MAG: AAA family ATPase [Anaerolineales bacterium]|nr:AAA family ATPase [Anaerolineales bacterium]